MSEDVIHLVIELFLGLVAAFVAGLGWLIKASFRRIERGEDRLAALERSSTAATVQDHEVRLRTLEGSLAEINATLALVVAEIKNVKVLLEAQVAADIRALKALVGGMLKKKG